MPPSLRAGLRARGAVAFWALSNGGTAVAKTRCEVEEFTDMVASQYGDSSIHIPSVRARCSRCGHTTESGGTEERSITRCLVLMREQCPRGERHYYTTDAPKAPRRKPKFVRPA